MKFDNIYGAVNILIPEKNTLSNLLNWGSPQSFNMAQYKLRPFVYLLIFTIKCTMTKYNVILLLWLDQSKSCWTFDMTDPYITKQRLISKLPKMTDCSENKEFFSSSYANWKQFVEDETIAWHGRYLQQDIVEARIK